MRSHNRNRMLKTGCSPSYMAATVNVVGRTVTLVILAGYAGHRL